MWQIPCVLPHRQARSSVTCEFADFHGVRGARTQMKCRHGEIYKVAQTTVQDRKSKVRRGGIKCLSFFSGALGLDLGLESAGIYPLLACETDGRCRETITANRPDLGLIGDLRDYAAANVIEISGLAAGEEVDLIVGGPPARHLAQPERGAALRMKGAMYF